MLQLREYSRNELLQIYNTTSRLDAIKSKIKRQGYCFKEEGRGNSYKMIITALPSNDDLFKQYCIKYFDYKPQTDFNILKYFLYNLFTDNSFITLQFNEMVQKLKQQGINTTSQTVSNYFNQLVSIDLVCYTQNNFVYYVFDKSISQNRYLTRNEYLCFYSCYWHLVRSYDFSKAESFLLQKYGSKPKKRNKAELNGIYTNQIKQILKLLEQEFNNVNE